jgi:hypothetical protein
MASAPLLDLVADLMMMQDREESGWVVVVVDCEPQPPRPVSVYGIYPSPWQALAKAAHFDRDPRTGAHPQDGSPPWQHVVVPIYLEAGGVAVESAER